MKAFRLVVLVVTLLYWPVSDSRAQSGDLEGGIFWAPNSARRVTLTRNGALMASFEVPEGTFLSASYDDQQPSSIQAGHWEFHGDFELRAQPLSESPPPPGGGRRMEEIMRDAPLTLTVQDVDVLIENVSR
jgi:hypothetical protein